MKLFGRILGLTKLSFFKSNQEVSLLPNQATTYTANRNFQLPEGDTSGVLLSESGAAVYQPLDADLTSLAANSTSGLVTRTTLGNITSRTILAGSSKTVLSNASGVSGNPILDISEVDLSHSNISGTIPITSGGTGNSSKAAAFDALSPVMSKGDLVTGNSLGLPTRLPIGIGVLRSSGPISSSADSVVWEGPRKGWLDISLLPGGHAPAQRGVDVLYTPSSLVVQNKTAPSTDFSDSQTELIILFPTHLHATSTYNIDIMAEPFIQLGPSTGFSRARLIKVGALQWIVASYS